MDEVLLWLSDRRPEIRVGLAVLAAALVYLLGRAVVVAPLEDRTERVRAEVREAEQRLEADRRRLGTFEPAPESLLARMDSLRVELRRATRNFSGGVGSGQLTVFSTLAEEAGAEAPLFNLRGSTTGGGSLDGLRLLTVQGDMRGGTLAAARFLEALAGAPLPVVVDSLALFRQVPDNAADLKLRVLAPAEGE